MKAITLALASILMFALPILANPIEVVERSPDPPVLLEQAVLFDDQDYRVYYSAGWSHLQNQGHNLRDKTISYTNVDNAEVFFPSPVPWGENYTYKVTVWSSKNDDRGIFNVYCGQKLLGSGNEYSNGPETNSQIVFQNNNAACAGGQPFVVKNDRGANYIAIDYLKLEWLAP